jgi:oxygen-independent coproporphyrinogen-3 oxidase
VLRALGRTHDPANVDVAVRQARRAGFERINVDLIYGTPGESARDWRRSLEGALALGVSHVSAYALTVEPATPLGRRVAGGETAGPDDDIQADDYLIADDVLGDAGLQWYEISSWARPGDECRHNLLYWTQGEYLAIGCAAHGHIAGRRWWNVRTPERYIAAIEHGESPEAGAETLDVDSRREEALTLALRTRAGAPSAAFAPAALDELVAAGLLTLAGEHVVLTRRGRLLASEVTARLMAATDRHPVAAPHGAPERTGTR